MTVGATVTRSAQPSPPASDAVAVGRASALWVLLAGVVGGVAALTLTIEKIAMLRDPGYVPSCSLNPVLSCGSVMVTPQAEVFGFPNPLIGIVGFSVVTATGVLALARVALPRWWWGALAVGTGAGVVFVHWLIFQSIYRIGALCPYCMVVWSVTVPLFVVVAAVAATGGREPRGAVAVLHTWRWSLTAMWFIGVVLLITVHFWDYWSTLLP